MAAAAVAAVGAFLAVPFFVRSDAVREAVQNEIRYATGFDLILRSDVTVSAFPSSSASFFDISLSDEGDARPALTAERLTAQLRLLPLLIGRIEVADVTLIRPQLLIEFDAEGRSNWTGLLTRLSQTLRPQSRGERAVSFSEIRLVNGAVNVRSAARGVSEEFDGVDLSLAWPSISRTFGATGQFVWRDEKVDASLTLNDFLAALSGERSGLKLRMTSNLLKLAFDGHIGHKPTLKIDGTVAADSVSLRSALRWMGQRPLPGSGFGRFALKAQASVVGETVAFSSVNLELDGNAAEGVLTLTGDTQRVLQGTLAADEFNVTPYVADIRLLAANERHWNRAPITLEGLASVDFDIRLSASKVTFADSKLGRTAVGATLRNGQLAVTIGESQAFGGVLKGSVALAQAGGGADLKAQLRFNNVELENCLQALFGVRRLEGKGNVALAFEASGKDIEALARAAHGVGSLTATSGVLTGLNVEQALRRLERRPLSGAGDLRSGRTPFEKLAINVRVADGKAVVEGMRLEGATVRLVLGGTASIPARDLDLQGVASLVVARDAPPFELPFVVRGSWDDPVMTPDVQSLIRHSGAAAPLLEAVKSGRSRDAVRSVIEQMTRGEPAGAAPAIVAPPPAPAAAPQR